MAITEDYVKKCDQAVDDRIPLDGENEVNVHLDVLFTVGLKIKRLQVELVRHNFPGINLGHQDLLPC